MDRLARTAAVAALFACASAQAATCPRAVFFDLGDTLLARDAQNRLVAMPGAYATLQALDAAGVQLGAITNVPGGYTRPMLDAMLADPDFLDAFDVVVLSSQAPAPKPDPAIYAFAHAQLPTPLPIAQAAFVGETLGEVGNAVTLPTQGARAAGMIGIHLSAATEDARADHTVAPTALPEIAALVARLCGSTRGAPPAR